MYINKVKKRKCIVSGSIQMYVGLFFSVVGFIGTMNMILAFKQVRSVWGMFAFMDVTGAILLFLSVRNLIAAKSCIVFDEVFQKSGGRAITVEEISFRQGMRQEVVLRRLQLLIKKRCLKNVSLNMEGNRPVIILENDALKEGKYITEYIVVYCPNCGSSCSVKRGSVANCEFCGGRVMGN